MSDWKIEHLSRKHERKTFTCSKDPLDQWIKESALGNEQKDLSRTYVAVRPGEVVVRGYYTLSACQVGHESIPLPHSKTINLRLGIPAMRLGRLAVDVAFQKQGLGQVLLSQALRRTLDISRQTGCALLTLDTRDEDARNYYLKRGFLRHSESMADSLFLPVKMIAMLPLRPIEEDSSGEGD